LRLSARLRALGAPAVLACGALLGCAKSQTGSARPTLPAARCAGAFGCCEDATPRGKAHRQADFQIAQLDAAHTDWSVYAHHPNVYVRGLSLRRFRDQLPQVSDAQLLRVVAAIILHLAQPGLSELTETLFIPEAGRLLARLREAAAKAPLSLSEASAKWLGSGGSMSDGGAGGAAASAQGGGGGASGGLSGDAGTQGASGSEAAAEGGSASGVGGASVGGATSGGAGGGASGSASSCGVDFSCPDIGECSLRPEGDGCVRHCYTLDFSLQTDDDVARLAAHQCEELDGSLFVNGALDELGSSDITSLTGLETLRSVTGSVAVEAPSLADLGGLARARDAGRQLDGQPDAGRAACFEEHPWRLHGRIRYRRHVDRAAGSEKHTRSAHRQALQESARDTRGFPREPAAGRPP